ncbi:MAG: hypothetical protein RMJ56_05000 [Gemmataceae bacterium]|nr:hypothetical protein [Gemmata sp.]MDW8196948.1 hypothetical protein [Gemmataceae bacterium]
MKFTRFLLPGWMLAAFAAAAAAQERLSPPADVIPSVLPMNAEQAASAIRNRLAAERTAPPPAGPLRMASLEQMATSAGPSAETTNPMGTLMGFSGPTGEWPGLPPGSYPSPYYVDGPGCCGPLGRNGRIGYEFYTYTGVNLPFGDGLPEYMNAGWTVGGGLRTLLFNASHTAAWTIDFGVSYTHNWAAGTDDPVNLFLRSPPLVNPFTGVATPQPDRLTFTAIREVHRTSFNYNLGRDVWLWGSGDTGRMTSTNWRVGAWVGGRYGTSHVDQIPLDEIDGYSRRQNVFLGVAVGVHSTWDIPMGGWILFGGVRTEYVHDWTNLTPPLEGNIHNVNLQVTFGIRY